MGDNLLAINLGGESVASVSTTMKNYANFTCALLTNGKTKCWGNNLFGQLGYGDSNARGKVTGDMATLGYVDVGTDKTVLAVKAGNGFACALRSSADIVCWAQTHSDSPRTV